MGIVHRRRQTFSMLGLQEELMPMTLVVQNSDK